MHEQPDDENVWGAPAEAPVLGASDVHVWRADLGNKANPGLLHLLSVDEKARADKFHFQRDREHFIAARGRLRLILARYLHQPAASLRFVYSAYGKPRLAEEFADFGLCFNLSHSGGIALFAVSRQRELGVDVELIRADLMGDDLAAQFFSAREAAELLALPSHQKLAGFFNCWTRKEACVKALGEGLTLDLRQIEVTLKPGEPARLLSMNGLANLPEHWSMLALAPGHGYAGALLAAGQDWRLTCWQCDTLDQS